MFFTIKHYGETDSTNLEAIRLYKQGEVSGDMVLVADYQTAGKGYDDNYWESEKGRNLLFSILLKPVHISPSDQFLLTEITSLSLTEMISELIPEKTVTIKWPNDIYVNDRKIAGILIQNFIKGNNIDLSVIGTGLNVDQHSFLPETPNPTSLYLETGKSHDKKELLNTLLTKFRKNYLRAISEPDVLRSEYLKKMYRKGVFHNFTDQKNRTVRGKIPGVSPYGQLLLETEQGQTLTFNFKEIKFVI
jgi:BirA family biotin operon repressor/biotin-[acetyl-CoA-carboxylase] ligase